MELPPHALAVLLLTAGVFVLLASGRLRLETTCLLALLVLLIGFSLFPFQQGARQFAVPEVLAGFGNEALVTICALMILGRGLIGTGALEPFARQLANLFRLSPSAALLLVLLFGLGVSGFVNDTPVVVLMAPMLVTVAAQLKQSASRTLLPMNYAVILGGMATPMGTSTNLLVVQLSAELGGPEFAMFDFYPLTMLAAAIALPYLWLILPRLLPDRQSVSQEIKPRLFEAWLEITPDSFPDGRRIMDVLAKSRHQLHLKAVRQKNAHHLMRLPSATLHAGDRLLVVGTATQLKHWEHLLQCRLSPLVEKAEGESDESDSDADDADSKANEEGVSDAAASDATAADATKPNTATTNPATENAVRPDVAELSQPTDRPQQLVELVISEDMPSAELGRRLEELPSQCGVLILGRQRLPSGRAEGKAAPDWRLGDVLLVQGSDRDIDQLKAQNGPWLVLDGRQSVARRRHATLALLTMVLVVAAAATSLLPLSVSAIGGVLLLLMKGAMRWRDVTDALSVKVVLLVVTSLALGRALEVTGGTDWLAQQFVASVDQLPTIAVISLLLLVMALFTNVISNNAAAVIGTPIALHIAALLQQPAEPFVLAILFGCNLCYATPVGYQTNLIVMSAANYRFGDFLRAGIPLLLLQWVSFTLLLAWWYQLSPL